MHALGVRMQTEVAHTDGTTERLFDKPFNFGSETHYYQRYDLLPGESDHTLHVRQRQTSSTSCGAFTSPTCSPERRPQMLSCEQPLRRGGVRPI
jgi:hypothetical protein